MVNHMSDSQQEQLRYVRTRAGMTPTEQCPSVVQTEALSQSRGTLKILHKCVTLCLRSSIIKLLTYN